jgi:hypothetical protein
VVLRQGAADAGGRDAIDGSGRLSAPSAGRRFGRGNVA